MKLWQKVFLCTLILTVLASFLISQVIIHISFENSVFSEQSQARSEHSFLTAGISSKVAYSKNRSSQPFLSDAEIESIFVQTAADQGSGGMAVYRHDGRRVTAANTVIDPWSGAMLKSLQQEALGSKECRVEIREADGAYYTVAASALPIEGKEYTLFTVRDISPIYQNREHLLFITQGALLIFTILFAAVLFFVLRRLLSPLRRIDSGIGQIARGDYSLRLEVKGSQEFRELSQNVNTMAQSVEENVERIQAIADGRKRFIDNLAHEMKTPLTSILGFADLLRVKRTVTDKQRRDFSGVIVEEAKRLRTLSGKLLELAVTNNTKPDYGEVDVDALFREMSLTMAPLLSRRGIRLLCDSHGERLTADRELIKSLLYNLIDNAAKASKEGEEVLLACASGENSVILSVSDWGIGMDEKTVRRATEAFYMADKSRSRKNGGAGLGLALCARIAEMHRARLRIKSRPGEGTTVFLAFPEKPPEEETEPEGGDAL